MSEIIPAKASGHGSARCKKMSTHIDMTPMVDLAFLLLTFFVLTTSIQKAFVLEIVAPEETEPKVFVQEQHVITLLIDKQNTLFWRHGISEPYHSISFDHASVQILLNEKKKEIEKMVLLIKASDGSRYQNLVDLMDEVINSNVERYCIVDCTMEDLKLIRNGSTYQAARASADQH